jgi:hypothetical protein
MAAASGPVVSIRLTGASSGRVRIVVAELDTVVELTESSKGTWVGSLVLDGRLPESLDSVDVSGIHADALFGDSARSRVRVASPWYPSSLVVTPGTLDPRSTMRMEIRVTDRDEHPDRVDTVEVRAGGSILRLIETGLSTGLYVLDLPVSELDPLWGKHSPRQPWSVPVEYTDPLHPADVSKAQAILSFDVPRPDFRIENPLVSILPEGSNAPAFELLASPGGDGASSRDQGLAFEVWETCKATVYVFDHISTHVAGWSGTLEAGNPASASTHFLRWNGTDASGKPVASGVFHVRVVFQAEDGTILSNSIFTIGRSSMKDGR